MEKNTLPTYLFTNFVVKFSPALKLSSYQGRCSGGVIVMFKKLLLKSVTITDIIHDFENIIAFKLCHSSLAKDIVFLSAYIPPYSSPFYDSVPYDNGISILDECICSIQAVYPDCDYVICGDLNARISSIQPVEECEMTSRYLDDNNCLSFLNQEVCAYIRKSEDNVINGYGKLLVELCASFGLIVVNGFNKVDPFGSFTFVAPQGNSVVDYFLVSENLISACDKLTIDDRVESWHMPIVLTLRLPFCTSPPPSTRVVHSERFVWDQTKTSVFTTSLNSQEDIQDLLSLFDKCKDDVETCITSLTKILLSAAECMKRSYKFKTGVSKTKSDWYDSECYEYKRKVRKSLRKYRERRCEEAKLIYVYNRRMYKKLLKQKQYDYNKNKLSSLFQSLNKPNDFWKQVRSIIHSKRNATNNIDINDWYTHFLGIFSVQKPTPPICNEPINMYVNDPNVNIILNSPITEVEVRSSIEASKRNKSPGPDKISNEMLATALELISPLLTDLFQQLFENSTFPSEWRKSIIVPVHKKGDINSCDNYRPISLTSLVSKIFTSIMNKRLIAFSDACNIIPEEQAGFREGYCTIDHMFSLYAMVQKQFMNDRKLYVCFIDYRKCFDFIDRNALFHVLESNGINGKMLDMIKCMYSSVLATVRNNSEFSDCFECPIGLRQGCKISPTMFSIFMTEVSRFLNADGKHGIQFIACKAIIFHLFYADDALLVSNTPTGLQNQLNILHSQSVRLGLEVNLDKTKIIVFRKGGYLGKYEKWHLNGNKIEIVNSYSYLGLDFTTRMSFPSSTLSMVAKARKACNDILRSLNTLNCYNLNIFMKLFDAKIAPILSYGSELFGLNEISDIESVHLYALKRFLNVSIHCSNARVYADTGRYPLSITHKVKCTKFWLRLMKMSPNRICRQAFDMLSVMGGKGHTNWVTSVRDLLCQNGFGIVWMSKEVGNEKVFLNILKERLRDCFIQGWHSKMSASDKFTCFYSFKSFIQPERFLSDNNLGRKYRNALVKFRLGVSEINCHKYRFSLNRNKLFCPFCSSVKEDEFHVIFVCPKFEDLRSLLLPSNLLSRRNVNSMYILLANNNTSLGKYLFSVCERRRCLIKSVQEGTILV